MIAGKLDRRVQFLRAGIVDDGLQSRPGPHLPHGAPVWASRHQISDGERFRSDGAFRDAVARFAVRWSQLSAGITETDRLICEGVTYAISGIKEIGRREGIEITVSKVQP